uniref:Putative NADH dehydrogenase n=1 Tax=viral metagenome TaxID=1070528 RepID=A0A6H1ZAY7_9ZZZZ
MRVMITGISGYIGSVLAKMMHTKGWDIVGVDATYYGDPYAGKMYGVSRKDIRDITLADLHNINAVVHLAALSNDPLGELNPALTYDINYYATVQLAVRAEHAGVERFVFASSCSVYGQSEEELIETSPLNPLTAYARSKVNSEEALLKIDSSSFSPIILRGGTAYGFSPNMRFDLMVNNLVGGAITRKEIVLNSDGNAWRPVVHVKDIARAVIAVLESPKDSVHNQIFNVIPQGENYTVREIAKKVAESYDYKVSYGSTDPDSRSYRVSAGKIHSMIKSYQPKYSLSDGIAELFAKFGNLTSEQFEKQMRLRQLKFLLDNGCIGNDLRWI